MSGKESIKNQFLFKSYKGFRTRDLSVMKQKVSTGPTDKNRKRFGKRENTDKGSHPSGLNFQRGKTGLDGARELRWSPAAIHGEAGGSGGTRVISVSFRVGGWWCCRRRAPLRRRPLLRRTAARVALDLVGEGYKGQIEAWVSSLGARGSY